MPDSPTLRIFVTNSHARTYVQSTRLSSPVIARYPLIQYGGKITLTKITSNFAETMAKLPLPYYYKSWVSLHHLLYSNASNDYIYVLQYYYGLGSVFFLSDWSGLQGSFRANSRHRIDAISSDSALLHSMLQPRTRILYPYIINVDCCVVYISHSPRNLPRAARIVLSLSRRRRRPAPLL